MYQKRNREFEIIALYRSNYKTQFYLRDISKRAKIPLRTTQNILSRLEKNNIVRSRIEGKNKYFSLNLDNIQTKSHILQSEIYTTSLFLEKYAQLKTFLKSINTNVPLIIFGSFARFSADKSSDLDLLIISEKEQNLPFHLVPFNVHKVNLSEKTFVKALKQGEALIMEIIENHIILNNHSFFINMLWDYYGK